MNYSQGFIINLFVVLISFLSHSQNYPAMDSVEFCCEQHEIDSAFRTHQFKHILTIEVFADRTYCCGKTNKAKVKYKGKFVEYSPFIKLNKYMAVEFAVIRAYKGDVRFYLLNILLYAIKDKRWIQVSVHHWRFLQLGKMYPAPFYGERNTKDFYGFDGSFMIY